MVWRFFQVFFDTVVVNVTGWIQNLLQRQTTTVLLYGLFILIIIIDLTDIALVAFRSSFLI